MKFSGNPTPDYALWLSSSLFSTLLPEYFFGHFTPKKAGVIGILNMILKEADQAKPLPGISERSSKPVNRFPAA